MKRGAEEGLNVYACAARPAVAELVERHPPQSRRRRDPIKRFHVRPLLFLHSSPLLVPRVSPTFCPPPPSAERAQECRAATALAFWVGKV